MFLVRREDGISWDLQGFTFMGPVNRCEGGQCMCGAWGGAVSLLPSVPPWGSKLCLWSTKPSSQSVGLQTCGASWCISLRLRPPEVTSGLFLIHMVNHTPAPGWWQSW